MIIIGPSSIPLKPNTLSPPMIEKKISNGCIFTRSLRKKGRKKLSRKLIKNAHKIQKTIPVTVPEVKKILSPKGTHIIAQPNIGMNEQKRSITENNNAPSILKIEKIIKAAKAW